jgi:hypothetical protein
MILAIVAAFVAGTILGALFLHQSDPMQIVSNSAMAATPDSPGRAATTQLSE